MGFGSGIKGLTGGRNPAALGRRVIRVGAFADLDAVEVVPMFRITGGEVMLTGMYGKVTTLIAAACTLNPRLTPTIGAAITDMAATSASIAADPVDTILTWDGTEAGQIAPAGAGVIGTIGLASFATNFQILVVGVIGMNVAVVATGGAIDWIIHYIPLDPNAVVNAI